MAEIVIRAVEPGDADELVAGMRQADVDEILAGGRNTPRGAVDESVARSILVRTVTVDGRVACIFGLVPMLGVLGDMAAPWMLGTDLVSANSRALMRRSRPYIADMLQAYPLLFNVVHARNTRAVGWLRRIGFDLKSERVTMPTGEQFIPFTMEA